MKPRSIYMIFRNDFFILTLILFLGSLYIITENTINPALAMNIDESLWIVRSYNYINAVKNFDFVGGIQTVHPGITVMALSGIFVHNMADHLSGLDFYYSFNIYSYHLAFNVPIILVLIFFFFSFHYILRKLGFEKILSFFILVLFSVNLFYVLDSTPVDKFSAISILLSLSLLLVYVNGKFNSKKYLILSSFFAGFGVLSKLSALILVPFSLFILLYFSSLNSNGRGGSIKDFVLYLLVFFLSLFIIFPGFIIDPIGSVNAIIGASNSVLVSGFGETAQVYSFYDKISFYLGFFAVGSFTPMATGFLLFFIIFSAKRILWKGLKSDFSEENLFYKNILTLFIFGLVYFFYAIFLTNFLFYRYMLPLFLILDVGAAMGFYEIILRYRSRCKVFENINITALKFSAIFYFFQFAQLIFIYSYSVPV